MLTYHLNDAVDLSSRRSSFIDRSVDWIASHFKVNEETAIADFGCGPGLYAQRLAQRGAQVTGIDFSANSLAYARETASKENLAIDYIQANYLDFETTARFDLIMMIMCDFCALSPEQRKIMLSRFYTLLKPGGAVLLDVHSLNTFNQREEAANYELNQLHGFWSPDDYYCFVNTFKYEAEKVTLDKYTIIEDGGMRVVYNWLQAFNQESLQQEFTAQDFIIDGLYADVAGTAFDPESAEFAVVARRPQE